MHMHLVIACGGTGGHLFPGLAIAEEVCQRGGKSLIFISEKQIDSLAVRDHLNNPQIQFEKLPTIGLPPLFSMAFGRFLFGFARSLQLTRHYYQSFKPNAILGMGGFTSTAPILAGRLAKIPTFLHESNAIIGKANRLNARLAQKALLGFEACKTYFPNASSCYVTGTPIRTKLKNFTVKKTPEAFHYFGWQGSINPNEKIILIMGGSQGAEGINTQVIDSLEQLKSLPVRFIHFTGSSDESKVREAYQKAGLTNRAYIAAFCHEMQFAYSIADLAIARSGAASLTELSAFGIPSILIPFPAAAADHQTLNAKIFVNAGAAILLPESEIEVNKKLNGKNVLVESVFELCENSEFATRKLDSMSGASLALAPRNATQLIVDVIEKFS